MTLIAVDSGRVRVNVCLDSVSVCVCVYVCREIYCLACGVVPGGGWSKYTSERGVQWAKIVGGQMGGRRSVRGTPPRWDEISCT